MIFKSFKITIVLTLIAGMLAAGCASHYQQTKLLDSLNLTKYVDSFIGTAEHGHVFLGANVPFGAVQLGPKNIPEGWDWCSGYHYSSNTILGFTHTHLSGTGIGDLNDILILPTTGDLQLKPGTKAKPYSGYLSTFSHDHEVSKAGYYSVWLDRYKIKAELTASERVGFHKYTFSENGQSNIIIDLADGVGWDSPVKTYIKQLDKNTLVGYRWSKGWATDQRVYFAIKISTAIDNFSVYDSVSLKNGTEAKGLKIKGVARLDVKKGESVYLKVGISPISSNNALANINAEIPNWDFNKVIAEADDSWNKELSKIKIAADEKTKRIFYTALYHTMFAPSLFNDANGDYLGTDKKVYTKPGFNSYTTFSLWDTYRAFHPLYTILHPDKVNDIVKSFLAIYDQQGKLPVWHLMGNETNTMIGYHAIPVIVDAYLKGFRAYDVEKVYAAMKHSAMQKTDGIDYAQELKYIPSDKVIESVAKGLEYAIDDWCIATMAKALGKTEDELYFGKRAKLYQLYFDKQTNFMRGKTSRGEWRTPFNPVSSVHRQDDYTEGNAWQYTWLVPHDVEGLIRLFGGDEPFTLKLDTLFNTKEKLAEGSSPDISGLIGQFAQGNEPNHHIPYLFSFAGKPYKTAERVRQIMDLFYTDKPNGLCGNEDLGQMSAWYIYSALGFYPVNPANGLYVFGSPIVNDAVLDLGNGKKFHLVVKNNSAKNIYINKISLNGKAYQKAYILHQDIVNGGEMLIEMGDEPSATWGVAMKDRPYSK